ncbi:hypothetical protein [Fusobacterium varium]|jgi:hypothetical protein
MATKLQNFYFHNIDMEKLSKKKMNLKLLMMDFFKEQLGKEEIVKSEAKIFVLNNVDEIEKDIFFLKYEILNYGEKKNIKNKETKKIEGEINKNQYLEEFQYIVLKFRNNDSIDIEIQGRQIGMKQRNFYNFINRYFENLKKKLREDLGEELGDVAIRSFTYHTDNFFEKLAKLKVQSVAITGKTDEDIDIVFSNKFEYSAEVNINIKTKGFISNKHELKDFIEKKCKNLSNVKIKAKGINENKEIDKLFSEDLNLVKEMRIKLNNDGKILEEDIKEKMVEKLKILYNKGGYILN